MALAATLSFVVAALAWSGVYYEESLRSEQPFLYWLGLIGLAGLVLGAARPTRFLESALAISVGAVLENVSRIAVDTARDPTSHNLWPIELVLMVGFACLTALIGTRLGGGVRKLVRR